MASCSFCVPSKGREVRSCADRILVLVSARIGDVVFATPALEILRRENASAQIDVLSISSAGTQVLENNPYIDSVGVLPSLRSVASNNKVIGKAYDLIINLHDNQITREYIAVLGDFQTIPLEYYSAHQCEQMVAIVQCAVNCSSKRIEKIHYHLYPKQSDFDYADKLLKDHGVSANDILIGCHCGCHTVAKRGWKFWKPMRHPKIWPLSRYIELERRLVARNSNIRMVLTGSCGEKIFGDKFAKQSDRVINLIGQTTILQLATLLKSTRLLITPDTAPLHIAGAMDVPVVALHGPTCPSYTGAYPVSDSNVVIHKKNIKQITVDEVERAVLSLI